MSDKEMTYSEAEAILDILPEYHWLTRSTQAWWSATEIAKSLALHSSVTLGWLRTKQIPGAIENPGKWAVPRSALLIFLAKRHIQSLPDQT